MALMVLGNLILLRPSHKLHTSTTTSQAAQSAADFRSALKALPKRQ